MGGGAYHDIVDRFFVKVGTFHTLIVNRKRDRSSKEWSNCTAHFHSMQSSTHAIVLWELAGQACESSVGTFQVFNHEGKIDGRDSLLQRPDPQPKPRSFPSTARSEHGPWLGLALTPARGVQIVLQDCGFL